MSKPQVIREADKIACMVFQGIAVPMLVEIPDERVIDGTDYVYGVTDQKRYLVSEKVLKFNRKALRNTGKNKVGKSDPRMLGGEDNMIVKVGKPGSRERIEALRSQYEAIAASGEELSPFSGED